MAVVIPAPSSAAGSWTDVSGLRNAAAATVYQNTAAYDRHVSIVAANATALNVYVGTANPPTLLVAKAVPVGGGDQSTMTFPVPAGQYYKCDGGGSNAAAWVERQ